jgi:hypothetical protein
MLCYRRARRLSFNNLHSWLWAPAYAGATRSTANWHDGQITPDRVKPCLEKDSALPK